MKRKYMLGFALLEILVATVILCGLIYMFISFSQSQQRQLNNQNVGKQLSIVVNSLVAQIGQAGKCPNTSATSAVPLNQCITISPGFAQVLKDNQLDPSQATVTIGP